MPMYVYKCSRCDNKFERIVDFNSTVPVICSICGADSNKVYDESCQFSAHNLPNGHIGARAQK